MNLRRWSLRFVLALPLAVAAACSGASVQQFVDPRLPKLRAMGFRVAVAPFAVTAPEEGFLASSLGPVGEVLALEADASLPDRSRLGAVLRSDVVTWLRQSPFEVVDTWVSDTQLAHAGFDAAMRSDPRQAAAIAKALQVDGVLFGDVQGWNRSYYVVQSTAEVGLRLELRDAAGEQLFATTRRESVGSGVTGGPTGFVSAATEPLAGLRGSHLRELMRSVTRNAALDLGASDGDAAAVDAGLVPRLSLVTVARQHAGPWREGERIDVVALGTPDCEVRFDLGRLRQGVPMQQTARDDDPRGARATYAGHYIVQPGDPELQLPLFCSIRRAAGRGASSRYRWEGSVELRGATGAR